MNTKTIRADQLTAGHRRVVHLDSQSIATVEDVEVIDGSVIVHYENMSPDEFPVDHPVQVVDVDADAVLTEAGAAAAVGHLPESMIELFGEPIHVYTRAQAIADGELVDVTAAAREAGFRVPVALTRAAWEDTVRWTDEDEARKPSATGQSETGRLHDVLSLAHWAIRHNQPVADRIIYPIERVRAEGRGVAPHRVSLIAHIGGGDNAEPVLTIMLTHES